MKLISYLKKKMCLPNGRAPKNVKASGGHPKVDPEK